MAWTWFIRSKHHYLTRSLYLWIWSIDPWPSQRIDWCRCFWAFAFWTATNNWILTTIHSQVLNQFQEVNNIVRCASSDCLIRCACVKPLCQMHADIAWWWAFASSVYIRCCCVINIGIIIVRVSLRFWPFARRNAHTQKSHSAVDQ